MSRNLYHGSGNNRKHYQFKINNNKTSKMIVFNKKIKIVNKVKIAIKNQMMFSFFLEEFISLVLLITIKIGKISFSFMKI